MATKDSAISKAREYLLEAIRQHTWKPGDKLPSLAGLAELAGVSRTSVWKAVSRLKQDRVLLVKERGKISLPLAEGTELRHEPAYGKVWEKKRARVIRDILDSRYSHDEALPPLAKLQARYGASYTTLRKILDSLVTDRFLIPFKKSYLPPSLSAAGYRQEIVCIVDALPYNRIRLNEGQARKVVDALESACSKGRLRMQLAGFNNADPASAARICSLAAGRDSIAGFIIDLWWWSVPEVQKRILDLLHSLAQFRKPVAILDEIGNFSLPLQLSALPYFTVFRVAGASAGQAVARHLLGLGHRRVAFFSFQHKHIWSQNRFHGLAAQYEKAGLLAGVSTHTIDKVDDVADLFMALLQVAPAVFDRMHSRELNKAQRQDLIQSYRRVQQLNLVPHNSATDQLRASARAATLLDKTIPDAPLYISVLNHLKDESSVAALPFFLEPLFQRALDEDHATAWVAADDRTALAALEFLQKKDRPVPGRISVVGFDNNARAIENGLTTIDFNAPLIVEHVLRTILQPGQSRRRHRSATHEIECLLIERESTGRAAF